MPELDIQDDPHIAFSNTGISDPDAKEAYIGIWKSFYGVAECSCGWCIRKFFDDESVAQRWADDTAMDHLRNAIRE